MVCVFVALFFICMTTLQACPEPVNVHIQNYDGPIILHTANCDQQLRNHGNQNKQYGHCETECTCVSKHSYAPMYGGSLATNIGPGCCPAGDVKPLVYCGYNGYGSNGNSNSWCGNQGYQSYPNCQSKYSGCY